ncbi:DUF2255 family protein [Curtobacterium sp. NPDC090217]|uniref:DUF2255 family protein n=1 Tax=Curtobacterium sp. NPDC090217 TaxID=3363970 RepID=UPI0038027370
MPTWNADTIAAIASSDDLHVSPFRADGVTYGTPTWIWSVVVDGDLYVRAYNGRNSRWYRSAIEQGAGRISAAGTQHDVTFEAAGPDLNSRIDAAYETKYAGSEYLPPMLQDGPTSATVRISPRS